MKPAWLKRLPSKWRAHVVRIGFNLHPAFRGAGGRVIEVSPDLRRMRVRLPYSWRTRNVVGSLYGGSLFAITDGAHPMMLMAALGDDGGLGRELDADRFYGAIEEGLRNDTTEAERGVLKPSIDALAATMRSIGKVVPGDVVTLDFSPDGLLIAHNGIHVARSPTRRSAQPC